MGSGFCHLGNGRYLVGAAFQFRLALFECLEGQGDVLIRMDRRRDQAVYDMTFRDHRVNHDGTKDIVVFEKATQKILPFLVIKNSPKVEKNID